MTSSVRSLLSPRHEILRQSLDENPSADDDAREGPRLRGTIVPNSSADWQLLRSDGVLEMDLRFTLRTDDGVLISMSAFGLRHGPPEVIAAIGRGETVDPSTYYFRTMPRFETAHPAYSFLNHLIAVASGDRRPEGPIYTIHEVI